MTMDLLIFHRLEVMLIQNNREIHSQTHLISYKRDCLHYVILNRVDIKMNCLIEVNVNIQTFVYFFHYREHKHLQAAT